MPKQLGFLGILVALAGPAMAGPLHDAVKDGNIAEVERLIAEGEDVNQTDTRLGTPLHQAAIWADAEMVELLLDKGADVNADSPLLGTPLSMAAIKDNMEVVVVLLAAGADQRPRSTDGRTPLHAAAVAGDPAIIQLLVDAGGDVNARTTDDQSYAPTHSTGLAGHFDVVRLLRALGTAGPAVESVTGLLSTADVTQGEELFESNCSGGCHAIEANPTGHRAAPNLWGVIGRDKASIEEFRYSRALKRTGGTWTFAELNAYLVSPTDYIPGTNMHIRVEDAADRANLMAFLQQRSDAPLPLPLSPK